MTGNGTLPHGAAREEGPAPTLILAGLILLALVLRFWRLGDWSFEATEIFTLRDSVRPQFHNPRPLGYLLTYYLVRPFRPLDEFGLRLLPAAFGLLAIPAIYAVGRRLIGTRAALLATLLVTVSALQVYYSQFARYWSLVFLLSAIYPYALYLGVRRRSFGALTLGAVSMVLAVLAHPVSVLLVGGPALWLLVTYARPYYLKQAWQHRTFRWGAVVAVVLLAALLMRVAPMLENWISMHDRHPGMSQFLRAKLGNGAKQVVLLVAYAQSLSIPVVLAAVTGVFLLWRERDRTLAIFLTSLAVFPLVFVTLLSVRTPVSTFYLLPVAPVFYLTAGVFFDRLFQVDWKVRPQWLIPATLLLAMISTDLPTLVSQYRNGRRFDFRGVAGWLTPRLSPGDVVASDQPMVMSHYLSGAPVQKLRPDTAPLAAALQELHQNATGAALWIVAPAPAHAFRTTLKEGGLGAWMYTNCQLRNTVGRGRLDFRQQYLQVFRCPPAAAATAVGAGRS